MNQNEQKNHKTATGRLENALEDFAEATDERIATLERDLRELVGAERTHRLKLADEQRSYVDARDRERRECCQERWDSTSETHGRILRSIGAFRDRTFLGRLRWIFKGI